MEAGKRAVKAGRGRMVGRAEGGRRKEVRIVDSVGGMVGGVVMGRDGKGRGCVRRDAVGRLIKAALL